MAALTFDPSHLHTFGGPNQKPTWVEVNTTPITPGDRRPGFRYAGTVERFVKTAVQMHYGQITTIPLLRSTIHSSWDNSDDIDGEVTQSDLEDARSRAVDGCDFYENPDMSLDEYENRYEENLTDLFYTEVSVIEDERLRQFIQQFRTTNESSPIFHNFNEEELRLLYNAELNHRRLTVEEWEADDAADAVHAQAEAETEAEVEVDTVSDTDTVFLPLPVIVDLVSPVHTPVFIDLTVPDVNNEIIDLSGDDDADDVFTTTTVTSDGSVTLGSQDTVDLEIEIATPAPKRARTATNRFIPALGGRFHTEGVADSHSPDVTAALTDPSNLLRYFPHDK